MVMMLFQPELGWSVLELLGRSVDSGCRAPLQKQETKRIGGGSLVTSPMPKLVLSGGREDRLLREWSFVRTFHRWGGLVFIMGDYPNWMVIRTLSYWMRDFLSLSLSD